MRAVLLAAAVLSACATTDVAPPVSMRDSAGIRIIENRLPESAALSWRVAPQPMMRIGDVNADSAHQLHHPMSAVRLHSGLIVVADQGDAALRFFDTTGTSIRSVGRDGDGPGEFRFLWWVRRWAGDSLVAYDATLFRLSIFDSAGRFHRSLTLPGHQGLFWRQALDVFENGDILVYGIATGNVAREEGPRTRTQILFRWKPPAADLDSLGPVQAQEMFAARMGRMFLDIPVPFSRIVEYVPWKDRLLTGWTGLWELHRPPGDGEPASVFRLPSTTVSVTAADRDAAIEFLRMRSQREEVRQAVTRVAHRIDIPVTMPAFGRWAWERVSSQDPPRPALVVDAEDNIWVLQYRAPGAPRGWEVLREDGRWLGTVHLPEGLEPFEIGEDYLLGWRKSDLGVISVELYELDRGR